MCGRKRVRQIEADRSISGVCLSGRRILCSRCRWGKRLSGDIKLLPVISWASAGGIVGLAVSLVCTFTRSSSVFQLRASSFPAPPRSFGLSGACRHWYLSAAQLVRSQRGFPPLVSMRFAELRKLGPWPHFTMFTMPAFLGAAR